MLLYMYTGFTYIYTYFVHDLILAAELDAITVKKQSHLGHLEVHAFMCIHI